jgi:transglutaminase-like putative cysteine protease
MKTFSIQHRTHYSYSEQIMLEFHTLHLRPASNACQRLTDFKLVLQPKPQGITHFNDAEGNPTAFAWFSGSTMQLDVTTDLVVSTLRDNPYDYLLTKSMLKLPIAYTPQQQTLLAMYLKPYSAHEDARHFAQSLAEATQYQTVAFLDNLNREIHQMINHTVREHGGPMTPEELLQTGQGACRDVAYLFINSCRLLGVAARFVSGYQEFPDVDDENHLHAWVEVYLPHAGWRGYDPSMGLAISDGHIALAHGADAASTMPVIGSFRGTASSNMEYSIKVTAKN